MASSLRPWRANRAAASALDKPRAGSVPAAAAAAAAVSVQAGAGALVVRAMLWDL